MVLNLSGVMNPFENVMKRMGLLLRAVHRHTQGHTHVAYNFKTSLFIHGSLNLG